MESRKEEIERLRREIRELEEQQELYDLRERLRILRRRRRIISPWDEVVPFQEHRPVDPYRIRC